MVTAPALHYNGIATTMPSSVAPAHVLIADDQQDVREALRLLLKAEGYVTHTAESPAAVIETLQRDEFDVVLIDLNYARDTTSGQEGLDLFPVYRRSTAPCLWW